MRRFLFAPMIIALIGISCAPPARADGDALVGTLLGAGLGGLFGNQFGHGAGREFATLGGAIFGGLVGNDIGTSMEYSSRSSYNGRPVYYPGPVYAETTYEPNYVAPPAPSPAALAYYGPAFDRYCREYVQEIRVGGQTRESYSTACLQPDGNWWIVP